MRLYEITAMVKYSVVIAALSEEDAMKHVKSWEQSWPQTAEFTEVGDVEVLDEREMTVSGNDWNDEAHDITSAALLAYRRGP